MSWFDKLFGDNGRAATKKGECNRNDFLEAELEKYDQVFSAVFSFIEKHGKIKLTKYVNFTVKNVNDHLLLQLENEVFELEKSKLNKVLPFRFRGIIPNEGVSKIKSLALIELVYDQIDKGDIITDQLVKVTSLMYALDGKDNKFYYDSKEKAIYEIFTSEYYLSSRYLHVYKHVLEKQENSELHKISRIGYSSYNMENYTDVKNCEADFKFLNYLSSLESVESVESVWMEYIFEMRIFNTISRNNKLKDHLEKVFDVHKKYNDMAVKYDYTPAADITNFKTYMAFLKLRGEFEFAKFEDYEIENYLRNIGKYSPN